MIMRRSILGVVMTGALLGQGVAQAEPYMGLGLGQSMVDFEGSDFDALYAVDGFTTSTSVDDGDTAWKIFGGYRLNENFAVEAAYVDYGTITADSIVTVPLAGSINVDLDATAWAIDAVGIMPLVDGFDLFGKLGVAAWDIDSSITVALPPFVISGSPDDDGTDFHFGVGASLIAVDNIAMRLEWERISGDDSLDVWSLGVQYSFE